MPYGENVTYDTDFDLIKSEIVKLGGADYDLIEKSSLKILKEKSKDIRVICYLALCYIKSEDWEKFADVFEGLALLVEQNYDALFPEKERGKQLAFRWLSEEKFNSFVEGKKPAETNYEHIVRLINALSKIKPILESKFPDGSPFPSNFFKAAQQWEKICKPKPKVEAAAGTGSGASPTQQQGAEPMETPKQAQNIIRKAALFLIEKEPTKSMGYRLLRSVRWDILEKIPPSENGKTQINGPNEQQRAYFQKLVADKEWKTIIEKGEQIFASGGSHLWLDLQRIIATACKELGTEYVSVYNSVLTETAILIKRIPEIINCSFADGTPFCDAATKEWLASDVKKFLGDDGSSKNEDKNKAGSSEADSLVEEQKLVNELVASGKFEEALAFIQQKIMGSSNERDNFRRRIMIGSILLKAKQPDIAISVLESLNKKIEESNLDRWDPETAVEAWSILYSAYKVVKAQKPQNVQVLISEKQNDILGKISKVDAAKAFSINK